MNRKDFYPEAGRYLRSMQKGFRITRSGGTVALFRFGEQLDAEGFRAMFCEALERRIMLKGGTAPVGRKTDSDYERGLIQDRRDIDDYRQRRIRIGSNRFRTPEIQKRFGHLIDQCRDD